MTGSRILVQRGVADKASRSGAAASDRRRYRHRGIWPLAITEFQEAEIVIDAIPPFEV